MKINLYYHENSLEVQKIKNFLIKNNLLFDEIILENKPTKIDKIFFNRYPLIKITKSHSINVIEGYNEFALNQLLEHIEKYKLKIELD